MNRSPLVDAMQKLQLQNCKKQNGTQFVRANLELIEQKLQSGVPQETLCDLLNEHGLAITYGNFRVALSRARKNAKKTPPEAEKASQSAQKAPAVQQTASPIIAPPAVKAGPDFTRAFLTGKPSAWK